MAHMKMVMLGQSNSGKTCYLLGTAIRMLEGVGGFCFNSCDYDAGLDLEDAWFAMTEPGAAWPMGTNESTDYEFSCIYRGKSIGTFTWYDYRGGALQQRRNGDDITNAEAKDIAEKTSDADVILVCLPANCLLDEASHGRMFTTYLRVLGAIDMRHKILIFEILKGDYCQDKRDVQKCFETVRRRFDAYFNDQIEHVMISRCSLGIFQGEQTQNAPIDGKINPVNIHLPILFPFYLDLKDAVETANGQQASFTQTALEHKSRGMLARFFKGDEHVALFQKADAACENAQEYQRLADAIWNELAGAADIYERGVCVHNSSGV